MFRNAYEITHRGKPPALPGDSPRFDFYDGLREFLTSTKRKKCNNDHEEIWRSAEELAGKYFWAKGHLVSTVGLDENMVRAYIRNQEEEDERYDQMKLPME